MFIKQKVFEKLLNEAYKGSGVYIGCTENDLQERVYCIGTSSWAIWVDTLELTKEAKGAIIKLCGDLPSMGEAYRAVKDYDNQYEMEDKYDNLLAGYAQCKGEVRKTKLCVSNNMSVLQSWSGKIYLSDKKIMDLVDYSSIQREEGEKEPVGPHLGANGTTLYWRNEVCTLMICLMEIPKEEKEFWEHVGQMSVI